MNGIDKIQSLIIEDANNQADEIMKSAQIEADKIINNGQIQCEQLQKDIIAKANIEVEKQKSLSDSSIQLQKKQKILQTKQQIISDILDSTMQKLLNMNDDLYFNIILQLIVKNSIPQQDGIIIFCDKDLARLPDNFEKSVNSALKNSAKLSISTNTCKITGGFLLSYDGIEENCSFEAIFDSLKDEMRDKVNKLLFS